MQKGIEMDREQLIDKIRSHLADEFGLEPDLAPSQAIFSSNLLDSLNSVQILMYLESELAIKISPLDVSLEDFDSLDKIASTVERLS